MGRAHAIDGKGPALPSAMHTSGPGSMVAHLCALGGACTTITQHTVQMAVVAGVVPLNDVSRVLCVRALGMPGCTDAGVSSTPLERQRYRGNRGPQVACDPPAHMSRREGLLQEDVSHVWQWLVA